MSFESIKGHARAKRILSSLLKSERIPSVLLFVGKNGIGKKLTANAFINALFCKKRTDLGAGCQAPQLCENCSAIQKGLHPDAKWVNADYQANLREEDSFKQRTLRVDTIRHLRQEMSFEPLMGGWKVAVIEDAETLENQAANALLKILEEPPRRTLWILLSAKPTLLPKTVLSRSVQIPFSPLAQSVIIELLVSRGIDPKKAENAAQLSGGSVGSALQFLEKDNWPQVLTQEPLAALNAAESLPRELPLARKEAEFALFSLTRGLNRAYHLGHVSFDALEKTLKEITWFKNALRSNADPRSTLLLACLEAQSAGL